MNPVLQEVAKNKLAGPVDGLPRIWLIGRGAGSFLLFHAAGDYDLDVQHDLDNCLSRCISSYIPSIKSLEHARQIAPTAATLFAEQPSLLVITMPRISGHGELSGANMEKETICSVAE